MFTFKHLALMVSVAAIAGACAVSPANGDALAEKLARKHYEIMEPVDHIQNYRIDGWNYVDDYNVVFNAGPSEYYLVTFNQRCLNLSSVEAIAFSTTLGRVTRFDKVLVHDRGGLTPESCFIKDIRRLRKVS